MTTDPGNTYPSYRHEPEPQAIDKGKYLRRMSNVVTLLDALYIVGTLIGGIGLATTKETNMVSLYSSETTHPYVGLGIGVVIAGLLTGTFILMMTAWADAYADTLS